MSATGDRRFFGAPPRCLSALAAGAS